MKKGTKIFIGIFVLVVALPGILLLTDAFYYVEKGNRAVLLRFGNIISAEEGIPPGLHLKMPISDEPKHIKTDNQLYQFSIEEADSQAWDVSVSWQVTKPNLFYTSTSGRTDVIEMRMRARILNTLRESGRVETRDLKEDLATHFGVEVINLEAKLRDSS